jgi:hypothetical protein
MKIEKKLIAISILAITIGIATVIPPAVFMSAKAQDAQANADPWFNIEALFAYFRVDLIEGGYRVTDTIDIQPSLAHNALTQQGKARIEYFEFTFYTDDGELLKEVFSMSMTNDDNNKEHKQSFQNVENIRENMLNMSYLGVDSLSSLDLDNFNDLETEIAYLRGMGRIFGSRDDKFSIVLEAQTIYLDVRRLCYITSDSDNTVITWTPDSYIQHIELTKNGNAFIFGTRTADVDSDTWISNMDTFLQQNPMADVSRDLPDR